MKKNFNSLLSLALAFLMIISSVICGFAVNDVVTEESTTAIETTTETTTEEETTEESTTVPEESTTEETTAEESTTEETTAEETTTEESTTGETTTEEETTAEDTTAEDTTDETTTEESADETTVPVEDETTAPLEDETTSPAEDETTAPAEDETTAPAEDETTAPVEDETTAPVEDETTAPVEDETTAPAEDETTTPVEDETTAPAEDETTAPVEDETTAPVEDETTSPSEDETTAPVEDETTSPAEDETTAPVEDETTAPVEDETTVPSEDETTDPSEEDTTAPGEDDDDDKTEIKTPVLVSAVDGINGITITWEDAFADVDTTEFEDFGYRIYKKVNGGEWEILLDINNAQSLLDSKVIAGNEYTYTVSAFVVVDGENIFSDYNADGVTATMTYVLTPAAPVATFENGAITVEWASANGATSYEIYRATSIDGEFLKIATVEGRDYYLDKNFEKGTTVYYKIIACVGDVSSELSEASYGVEIALDTTKISSIVKSTGTTVTLKWNMVDDADGYAVYRKAVNASSWKRIATLKANDILSYTDKKANGTYYYVIRAYKNVDGVNVYSALSNIVETKNLATPTLKVTANKKLYSSDLTWNKISGATGYQIFVKYQNSGWVLLKSVDAKTTKFSHEVFADGTYYYLVRAISKANGATTCSAFAKYGKATFGNLPKATFTLSSTETANTRCIAVKVKNNGKETIKVLSAGALAISEEKIVTMNIAANKNGEGFKNSVNIAPGKTATVYFKTARAFNYSPDCVLSFGLSQGGKLYVTTTGCEAGTLITEIAV